MPKNTETETRQPGLTVMQKLALRATRASEQARTQALNPADENRARFDPNYQYPIPTQLSEETQPEDTEFSS